jgi:Cellulase (glycosyl hydrolase family 5)
MRTVPVCVLFCGLTSALACGAYDIDAPERASGETNTPTTPVNAGGAGVTGSGASTGSGAPHPGSATGGNAGTRASGGSAGAGGEGTGSTGGAGGGGSTGGTGGYGGAAGSAGAGGTGNGGAGGSGGAVTDAGPGTAGRGGIDAAAPDAPGAGGSDSQEGGATPDAIAETRAPAREAGGDAGADTAWLRTSGNHIYLGDNVFHGRGANFHDTRSCNACAHAAPNVVEINRRADELIDNWKANFIRLDLESSASADNRVHWQGVLDDPTYQADVAEIVHHVASKGAYVLLSLWHDPTTTANQLPTDATFAVWRKLADMFKNEPRVLYGVTNEPRNDTDETVWAAMNGAVAAIREVEAAGGTPQHIVAVQGTQHWGRTLGYYVTHPITAGGGKNIVYETHVYDPASEFGSLFELPGQSLPVIIGEFGEQDADELMQRAEAAEIPYLAWTFHGRCPPNLLVDNSGGGCGIGMDLVPTAFGQKIKTRLASPW